MSPKAEGGFVQVSGLLQILRRLIKPRQSLYYQPNGPFTRPIFVAIFLILTHAIEWLSHKSIDIYIYSFAQMV